MQFSESDQQLLNEKQAIKAMLPKKRKNKEIKGKKTWKECQMLDILKKRRLMGNKWNDIAYSVGYASQSLIKNRYYSFLRTVCRYIQDPSRIKLENNISYLNNIKEMSSQIKCFLLEELEGKNQKVNAYPLKIIKKYLISYEKSNEFNIILESQLEKKKPKDEYTFFSSAKKSLKFQVHGGNTITEKTNEEEISSGSSKNESAIVLPKIETIVWKEKESLTTINQNSENTFVLTNSNKAQAEFFFGSNPNSNVVTYSPARISSMPILLPSFLHPYSKNCNIWGPLCVIPPIINYNRNYVNLVNSSNSLNIPHLD